MAIKLSLNDQYIAYKGKERKGKKKFSSEMTRHKNLVALEA